METKIKRAATKFLVVARRHLAIASDGKDVFFEDQCFQSLDGRILHPQRPWGLFIFKINIFTC